MISHFISNSLRTNFVLENFYGPIIKQEKMLKQINDITVKPVPLDPDREKPPRGAELVNEYGANIFLCAKKESGKTSVIRKMIKEFLGPETIVIAFVSTLDTDPSWIKIREEIEKTHEFLGYTSIKENGIDILSVLYNEWQRVAAEREKERKEKEEEKLISTKPSSMILFDDDEQEEKKKTKKKKKSKFRELEYILIFDDLSNELKNMNLVQLMKNNRHFNCKIIISSQHLNDLLPESRRQLGIWILFRGHPITKLKEIHRDADLAISFEEFVELYQIATKEPFNFFYFSTRRTDFRKNFNQRFVIEN